jgi:hypothetical protein
LYGLRTPGASRHAELGMSNLGMSNLGRTFGEPA